MIVSRVPLTPSNNPAHPESVICPVFVTKSKVLLKSYAKCVQSRAPFTRLSLMCGK